MFTTRWRNFTGRTTSRLLDFVRMWWQCFCWGFPTTGSWWKARARGERCHCEECALAIVSHPPACSYPQNVTALCSSMLTSSYVPACPCQSTYPKRASPAQGTLTFWFLC